MEQRTTADRPGLLPWEKKVIDFCRGLFREFRVPFFSTVIFGLMTHLFMLTNKIPNFDDVASFFTKGATITSGRWGLALLQQIIPNYSMPWYHGMLAIFFYALSVCVLVKAFRIRSRVIQALLGGLIVAFPGVTAVFFYMFTSSSYAVAFFCAVLPPLLLEKIPKTVPAAILSVVCITFATGIYQAFICTAASFLLVYLFYKLNSSEAGLGECVKTAVICAVVLIASLGLYAAVNTLVLKIKGTGMSSYITSMSDKASAGTLKDRIIKVYVLFKDILLHRKDGVIPLYSNRRAYLVAGALSAALYALSVAGKIRNGEKGMAVRVLLSAVMLILLPFAVAGIYFVASHSYILTLFGFTSVYMMLAVVVGFDAMSGASRVLYRVSSVMKWGVSGCMAVILVSNVFVSNEQYIRGWVGYERTYNYYSTVVSSVLDTPGFTKDTQVAFVGTPDLLVNDYEDFYYAGKIGGDYSIAGAEMAQAVYPGIYSYPKFIKMYLGWDLNFMPKAEAEKLETNEEIMKMGRYPEDGSVAFVDGVLVVRF